MAEVRHFGGVRVTKRVAITASQTGVTVWDPAAGKRFVLKKIIVSATTAGDIQLFDGTDAAGTAVGPIVTLGVAGGWSETWETPYRSAAVDNILKFTTGAGITGSVYAEGWEE